MGYVAEVPLTDDDLNELMNRMRAWLDHRRSEPSSFTLSYSASGRCIRVLFNSESDAAAFTAEFGGTQRSSSTSDVVAA